MTDIAVKLKSDGVFAFKEQKWAKAIEKFTLALSELLEGLSVTSCGASVLCKTETGDYRSGIVSDFDEGFVEVLFDDNSEEEMSVEPSKLTPIAKDGELQRSLYMNCARAEFKLGRNGRSANQASLALAVARVLDGEYRADSSLEGADDALRKKIADGLSIRGQALLKAGKHVMASQHADLLIDGGIDEAKGRALAKEVLAFRTRRMRSNRELSKQLASWVEVAMEESEKIRQGQVYHQDQDQDQDQEASETREESECNLQ